MHIVHNKERFESVYQIMDEEWLESNQMGGYAASSIINCNTRKYHGLLNLPSSQHNEKQTLLSKVELSIIDGEDIHHLSVNQYPGTIAPGGEEFFHSFRHKHAPSIIYQVNKSGLELLFRHSWMMLKERNAIIMRFSIVKSNRPIRLQIAPLLAYRNIHTVGHSNQNFNGRVQVVGSEQQCQRLYLTPYHSMPTLHLQSDLPVSFTREQNWFYNLEYPREAERGFDFQEDLFCPGLLESDLGPDRGQLFIYGGTEATEDNLEHLWQKELQFRQMKSNRYHSHKNPLQTLKQAGGHFLARNEDGEYSLTAGHPWFNDWGRDAMIALPGICFYSGREAKGLEVLKTFCKREQNGLLPNYLPINPREKAAYNSIDSGLWFFWTLQEYLNCSDDLARIQQQFLPTMQAIIEAMVSGQSALAEVHPNGLLWAGTEQTQLTWMDATVNGIPVTSRYGYAVELNALWYNALKFFQQVSKGLNSPIDSLVTELTKKIEQSFLSTFWNKKTDSLYDCINTDPDDAIRPNQLFAISLPYSPLTTARKKKILKVIEKELLTPYGLRTLAPSDPLYRPVYRGNSKERDGAYHQGTVWPWPLGHYVSATLNLATNRKKRARKLERYLMPLLTTHLFSCGVGMISEVFDGDAPHHPGGTPAQAWSVGEVVRAFELLGQAQL